MKEAFVPWPDHIFCSTCKRKIDLGKDEYEVVKNKDKRSVLDKIKNRQYKEKLIKCPDCGMINLYVDPRNLPIMS